MSELHRNLVEAITKRTIEPFIPAIYSDMEFVASVIASTVASFVTYVAEFTMGNLMSVLRLVTLANLALEAADAVEIAVQTSLDVMNQIVHTMMPIIERELNRLASHTSKDEAKRLIELMVKAPV